nr:OmpA family protein [Acinetobacter sp. Marseille-Q1620]
MNIIELLKDKVTSKLLEGDNQFQDEKIGALGAFYPVLLAVLKSKPELINLLQQNLNPRLGDIFSNHQESVSKFLGLVGGEAPAKEIENTLNRSITPTLNILADQAGGDDKQGIFQFIQSQWGNIQAALPAWATAFFAALGLNISGLDQSFSAATIPPATATPAENSAQEPKKSNWLLPIIALIILAALIAFFFKQCSHKAPSAGATDTATSGAVAASTQPAELHFSTGGDGNVANCQLNTGSQSFIDQLKTQVKSIFGVESCQASADQQYSADFPDQNAIEQVLAKVKGLPNVSLAWIGNQLTVQAGDATQAQKLVDDIKGLLPNTQVTVVQSADTAATDSNAGNSKADEALSNIKADQVNVNDIAAALNLQVINFATGSADIPAENKAILDKAANLIKQVPDAKLVVKGFTDNVGNPASNKTLSEKRAKSVADYLVSKGVGASQLTAQGFGEENPIADNTTKDGQFKNRRIEFEVSP